MRERKCLLAKILKSNALTLTNYISHIIVPEKNISYFRRTEQKQASFLQSISFVVPNNPYTKLEGACTGENDSFWYREEPPLS